MSKRKKKSSLRMSTPIRDPDYIVYTDGGCAYNPGGPGGYGVVIVDQDSGEVTELSGGYNATTNNRMEIMAILVALEHIAPGSSVRLHSDSEYALKCLSGVWRKSKNTDLWRKVANACDGKELELVWVKEHNGNALNERCDTLATEAIQSPDKQDDTGYRKQREVGREFFQRVEERESSGGGAMAVDIVIPPEIAHFDLKPLISPKEHVARYGVHDICAKTICEFHLYGRKKFADYLSLKTGGIDKYSRKSALVLCEQLPYDTEILISTIKQYVSEPKDIDSVVRWISRGLSVQDAIRKVLVDIEVRENAMRR